MSSSLENLSTEKRILIATVLCVVVSVALTVVFPPKPQPKSDQIRSLEQSETRLTGDGSDSLSGVPSAATAALVAATTTVTASTLETTAIVNEDLPLLQTPADLPEQFLTVDTPTTRYRFSSHGGVLKSCRLKNYPEIDPPLKLLEAELTKVPAHTEQAQFWQRRIQEVLNRQDRLDLAKLTGEQPLPESMWVELVPDYENTIGFPLQLFFEKGQDDQALVYNLPTGNLVVAPGETQDVVMRADTPAGIQIEKRLTFSGDRPDFVVAVSISAPEGMEFLRQQLGSKWSLEWPDGLGHMPFNYPGSQEINQTRVLLNDSMESPVDRNRLRKQAFKLGETESFRLPQAGRVGWINLENRYFLATFLPQGPVMEGVFLANQLNTRPPMDTRLGIGVISELAEEPRKIVVYAGPKITSTLSSLGGGLDRVVYDSWFGAICLLVEWLLEFFHSVIPSYGIAIVLLCVLSKLILYPLTYKQAKTQRKMGELQPKIAELKEKYKNDSQKLNQEQMKLWKKHGVNPAGGCLPMLAQIPIFIALYRTINSSIALRGASFLWIPDLSLPDMTFFLPFSLPFLGNALNVLPMVMTGVTYFQMQDQKKTMPDPNQAKMMNYMSFFFFFIFYHFSAGLVLYWLTNSVTQWIQQRIMEGLGHSARPARPGGTDTTGDATEHEHKRKRPHFQRSQQPRHHRP